MNSINLGFRDQIFDVVIRLQNGISAFKVDKLNLIKEAIRVTKSKSIVLLSSYSDKFWKDRLEWFRIQSKYKLIGEIDEQKTRDGIIVCKDGFTANTISTNEFDSLCSKLGLEYKVFEVDNSSVFCKIKKRG